MPINWTPFVEIVRAGKRFLLTSHMRPDCDALGSELAMLRILESIGKEASIINGDTVPPHIAFIDPKHRIQTLDRDITADEAKHYDTLIVLDTSSWEQLGPMAAVVRSFTGQRVVIDHHVSEGDFDAAVFKENTAEATGRIVLEAAEALGAEITPEIAAPLFAAIATDTGWFRFSSVGEATFAAVTKLVAAGASPIKTFSSLYERNSLARLQLRGRILTTAESHADGRVMFAHATLTDFAATGAAPTDTEDVVNTLLTVDGSMCAVLFIESPDGEVKISLRSRGEVDVRAVAEHFGGGGHTAAAGARFPGTINEAKTAILDALRLALR